MPWTKTTGQETGKRLCKLRNQNNTLRRLFLFLCLGWLLAGCVTDGHPEFLKSKSLYLLVDSQKDRFGNFVVYELEQLPQPLSLEVIEKLKGRHTALSVKSLGEFDDIYRPGSTYVILVRKVTSKGKKKVVYNYTKTELTL